LRLVLCATLGALWLLLAAACSMVTLGYASLPSLLAYRASDWFGLDGEQALAVKARADELHAWHRRSELPKLVRSLADLQARLERPLTIADADWLVAEAQRQYRATALAMVDQALPLVPTLRADQIARLERQFARRNREFAEKYIDAPAEAVRAARLERVEDNLADWIGPLGPEQRRRLAAQVEAVPVDYREMLADNQRRQRELVTILKRAIAGPAPAEATSIESTRTALARWATEWDRGRSPLYRAQVDAWLRGYEQLIVVLLNEATPAQKAHLRERLRGYANDLASFVVQAKASGG
jgi:hypothetical protein